MAGTWTQIALVLAIVLEVVATTFLQKSDGMTKPVPVIILTLCYAAAFYFLSIPMRSLPMGVVYAIWSGLGIVLISLIGFAVLGQRLDLPAMIGLALIIAGVLIINLFSKSVVH
ncbi:MAG: QacE family quaternary ammonium compound efflux SMR transporter [Rhodobacteraceae bacterium]|jgi:small multidrug resistance pump|nr:QacE family quaternary ammonium compound efflux SMR transporter [Paracoccaceae bacterium]